MRSLLAAVGLAVALAAPATSAHAASPKSGEWFTLEKVGQTDQGARGGGIVAQAGGAWKAGCQLTAYNASGGVIYSVTIWQTYGSDGTKIIWRDPPAITIATYYGWQVNSSSTQQWWATYPKTSNARGNYSLTQYVAGQPYQSRVGSVTVTVSFNGTWSCS